MGQEGECPMSGAGREGGRQARVYVRSRRSGANEVFARIGNRGRFPGGRGLLSKA